MTTLQFDATVCCCGGDGGEISFAVNITDEAHKLITTEIENAIYDPNVDWDEDCDLAESIISSKFPEIHQMILDEAQNESEDLAVEDDEIDCIMINYATPFQEIFEAYLDSLDNKDIYEAYLDSLD